ncbi:hypothetical protein KEM55_008123, partial [Ascosphaera atra]
MDFISSTPFDATQGPAEPETIDIRDDSLVEPSSFNEPPVEPSQSHKWSLEAIEAMVDSLIKSKVDNLCEGANFKPCAWNAAVRATQPFFAAPLQRKKLENRYQCLKKAWHLWKGFLGATSGWGRDDEGNHTADANETRRFFGSHPAYRKFSNGPRKLETKMNILFEGNCYERAAGPPGGLTKLPDRATYPSPGLT